jgi:hypothetical protein
MQVFLFSMAKNNAKQIPEDSGEDENETVTQHVPPTAKKALAEAGIESLSAELEVTKKEIESLKKSKADASAFDAFRLEFKSQAHKDRWDSFLYDMSDSSEEKA